jgi:uncharacterized SAM-binding protein YcdF (DUF218 family)
VAAGVAAIAAGVVGVTAYRVQRSERSHRQASERRPDSADVIVVFGAQVLPDRPSRELASRLDHAVELWRARVAPIIAASGGIDGELDEVAIMMDYLAQAGVPDEAIMPARPGGNTRETLQTVATLDGRRFVAVSSPYHSYRIEAEARRQHLDVVADCPATTPECRHPRLAKIRRRSEVLGVLFYAVPDPAAVTIRRWVGRLRHTVPHRLAGIGQTQGQQVDTRAPRQPANSGPGS